MVRIAGSGADLASAAIAMSTRSPVDCSVESRPVAQLAHWIRSAGMAAATPSSPATAHHARHFLQEREQVLLVPPCLLLAGGGHGAGDLRPQRLGPRDQVAAAGPHAPELAVELHRVPALPVLAQRPAVRVPVELLPVQDRDQRVDLPDHLLRLAEVEAHRRIWRPSAGCGQCSHPRSPLSVMRRGRRSSARRRTSTMWVAGPARQANGRTFGGQSEGSGCRRGGYNPPEALARGGVRSRRGSLGFGIASRRRERYSARHTNANTSNRSLALA